MAFFGVFVVTQTSDITSFTITDTSNYGSEGTGTFSGRTIAIYKVDGTLLVPEISFPFSAGNSYTVPGALLDDYSLSIVFNWLSLSPQPGSTYTETLVTTFLNYTKQFLYEKVQDIAAQSNVLNDTGYYESLNKVQTEVDNAVNATTYSDQFNAQSAIDRANYIIQNQSYFF
jgi:hypothetical protein